MEKISGEIRADFPAIVIEQLLNAIRLGSYEARQRFPRLLQIVSLYHQDRERGEEGTGHVLETFVNQTRTIPCWMFLGWLSQMTALLDKPEAKAVQHILEAICIEYPQAFVYPFKMSLEQIERRSSVKSIFIDKLKSRMSGHMAIGNQLVSALEQLASHPVIMFKDYLAEMMANFKNREAFLRTCREFYLDLVDLDATPSSQSSNIEHGRIRREFASFLKPLFIQEFGENGRLLADLTESQLKEHLTRLNGHMSKYAMKEGNLGEYSPWLKNFKRNPAKDLEIPGLNILLKY